MALKGLYIEDDQSNLIVNSKLFRQEGFDMAYLPQLPQDIGELYPKKTPHVPNFTPHARYFTAPALHGIPNVFFTPYLCSRNRNTTGCGSFRLARGDASFLVFTH